MSPCFVVLFFPQLLSDCISHFIMFGSGVCQRSISYMLLEFIDCQSKYRWSNKRCLSAPRCFSPLLWCRAEPRCLCVKSAFVFWKWTSSTGGRCFLPSRSTVWNCEVNTERFWNMTGAKTTAPLYKPSAGPIVMLCASFFHSLSPRAPSRSL